MSISIKQILKANKKDSSIGIYSICSANRYVIRAAMQQAKSDESMLLVESTCNQVNQFGGYTDLTPRDFVNSVKILAESEQFPLDRLILGGDHLGPHVWREKKAVEAMREARQLIRDYVNAGYQKIHFDTSMPCIDDETDFNNRLDPLIVAKRTAELCKTAEESALQNPTVTKPVYYVIGNDVPLPGGAIEDNLEVKTTTVDEVFGTIEATHDMFTANNLESAWDRVIAVVIQAGIEFGDNFVIDYSSSKARAVSEFIERYDNLVYEAHSTDYQKKDALQNMVKNHFAILKVGPWMTFTFREAIFALNAMEKEWLSGKKRITLSNIDEVIENVMVENPAHWIDHYKGDENAQTFARKYSYSDRVRYYWSDRRTIRSLETLLSNLSKNFPPLNLLSQYLPNQFKAVRDGCINNTPDDLILNKIREITQIYSEVTNSCRHYSTPSKIFN